MTVLEHPVPTSTVALLQAVLLDTAELAAQAKQAHWNVHGPAFLSVHRWLDDLASLLRGHTDVLAERISALGGRPDARTATVAAGTTLPAFPSGEVSVEEALGAIAASLGRLGLEVTVRQEESEAAGDSVTTDLLIALLRDLDDRRWVARAHL